MKKIGLFVMLGLMSMAVFAQQTIFTIKGTINWRNNGYVYLSYQDKNGKFKTDSSAIFNQLFAFNGEINEPKNAYLRSSLPGKNTDDPNYTSLFIEPGDMKLEITEGNYKNFKLKGCKMQDDATHLAKLKISINSELKPYQDAYKVANEAYLNSVKAKFPQAEQDVLYMKVDDIQDHFKPYNEQLKQIDYAFISKNPNSYLSAYLIIFRRHDLSLDSAALFYNGLSLKVKQSDFGKQIANEILK
ncbi:MAG: DUF4369 domain-containing protein [Pedobacter sp.]|nr:DUF4369 domain-containing protein [Pedobacter sp.]